MDSVVGWISVLAARCSGSVWTAGRVVGSSGSMRMGIPGSGHFGIVWAFTQIIGRGGGELLAV